MSYIDTKFLNLLSSRLPKFKRKSADLFNFRCPHCGDSKKSSSKARGFVYLKKNNMFFKCHNCGVGQTLGNLFKSGLSPSLNLRELSILRLPLTELAPSIVGILNYLVWKLT